MQIPFIWCQGYAGMRQFVKEVMFLTGSATLCPKSDAFYVTEWQTSRVQIGVWKTPNKLPIRCWFQALSKNPPTYLFLHTPSFPCRFLSYEVCSKGMLLGIVLTPVCTPTQAALSITFLD